VARTIAKDYDQKRTQILKSAALVFATQGFDRASMNQIAVECGISKANIYHYYSSKDALLFDILDQYLSGLKDRICTLDLSTLTPEHALHRVVHEILLAYRGMDHEHQIQTSGMPALQEAQQEILREYQRLLVDAVSAVIKPLLPLIKQSDAKQLRAVTMSVFGMLNWFYMWRPDASEQEREDYAKLVSNLTVGGTRSL
jgi:AcrR family transcriptional regulator